MVEHQPNPVQHVSTDKSIELLLDRITNAAEPQLVEAYEKRLLNLEEEKGCPGESCSLRPSRCRMSAQPYRTTLNFLANPWKLWDSGKL